jgi:hypothetical protein
MCVRESPQRLGRQRELRECVIGGGRAVQRHLTGGGLI